jgi:predicted TIM-barrel fold metal-dependent hydrolase
MHLDDMIIVSVDDHVVEPPDLFEGHLPPAFADRAPRLAVDDDGVEAWVFQGQKMSTTTATNAVVSWPKEDWGFDPSRQSEMRPGAYDVHERIRDMNRNGVLASMCFPTFPGFSGRGFQDAPDKDLSLVMLQAYNDWHIDELCQSYPGRFIPLALGPAWDVDALAAEVRRVARKGCRAITMPELPHVQGLPSYYSDTWDPFFRAVCDEDVTMCLHIGQGFFALRDHPDAGYDNLMILATQVSVLAAQDMLWGPALRKYPALKVAWSEGGIGWVPFYLDRCDRHYKNQKWTKQEFGGKLPSEVFKEHSLVCFITDPSALKLRREMGIDTVAFEADYPHSDCLWPDAPETLLAELEGAGAIDDEIDKISWRNAARFLGWDPFAHIAKADATVGGLRAGAWDVDTSVVSRREWRARYEAKAAAAARG